jgi:hydrogenase 3 maturation protease
MGADEQLLARLSQLRGSRALIVGIGNPLKGDDGAGPLVCQQLAGGVCADLIDAGTVPENYIQPIIEKAPQNLLIVDAVDFGGAPGAIGVFKPDQLSCVAVSTHALSPHLFIDIIRREIDADVYLIGIQPSQVGLGQSVCPAVSGAVERVACVLAAIFPPQG